MWGGKEQTWQRTGRTMCWEMINPPQRPLLRSCGTSSMVFGSHEQFLLHSRPPPCSFQADVLKHNFLSLLPQTPCPSSSVPHPFSAALWQPIPSSMHVLQLSCVPPPPISVTQASRNKQPMLGEGVGAKFKNCCSVSCFSTRIVPVSCTVLSRAEKPKLSYLLALCVPQLSNL